MSNVRAYTSLLDKDTAIANDSSLVSVVYKPEFGPMLLIESVTKKGNKIDSGYISRLSDNDDSGWKMFLVNPENFDFNHSRYLSFPLTKVQTAALSKVIESNFLVNLVQNFILPKSSDFDDNLPQKLEAGTFSATFFAENAQKHKQKLTESMHREFFHGISREFNTVFSSGEFPESLTQFLIEAEIAKLEASIKPII